MEVKENTRGKLQAKCTSHNQVRGSPRRCSVPIATPSARSLTRLAMYTDYEIQQSLAYFSNLRGKIRCHRSIYTRHNKEIA